MTQGDPTLHPDNRLPPLLELDQVTVRRDAQKVLDALTLVIEQKSHTAIIGPNGAGKTSLLKLLTRQFYPSVDPADMHQGSVRIMGRSTWAVDDLRRHFGIVSGDLDQAFSQFRTGQMTGLQAVLSGFDGVRLSNFIRTTGSAQIDRAAEALTRVGASHLSGRIVSTLSTGERRRVLIARALVHRPAALVLDEPSAGLDITARHSFLDQLERIAEEGTTIVLVTHHVEEIIRSIGHVIYLRGGAAISAGNRRELLVEPRLSDLFGISLRLIDQGNGRQLAVPSFRGAAGR